MDGCGIEGNDSDGLLRDLELVSSGRMSGRMRN
jgi:hypothetical protein